jgi:cysteine desulfurase
MTIYLDNAATTPLDPRVVEAMEPYLRDHFGNPSSTHSIGRTAKTAIESARKGVARLLGASTHEIYFTSGGTEADNQFLMSASRLSHVKHAITCATEHHAVLHTLEFLRDSGLLELHFVNINKQGEPDIDHLESLLKKYPESLVSLMHGNNEIGNLIDLEVIGNLCKSHGAIFHSDTVQTVAHFPLDLSALPVDAVAASAHKFHGPKGTGILYVKQDNPIMPLIHGGSQERNMRGGTENVAGIVGLSKALEIAMKNLEMDREHMLGLKKRLIAKLEESIPDITFNGLSASADQSLYTVLNLTLPSSARNDMLLFHLDLEGICASGGSACNSGATTGSHVLSALGMEEQAGTVRLSFSKFNTENEIDKVADVISEFCEVNA